MSILPLSTTRVSRVVFQRTLAYALTALLAIATAILTLAPVSVPDGLPGNDKVYHLIAFAGLVLPCAVLYPRALLWLLPCAVLFGGAIEIVQPAVGRDGEWPDFYADIWGVGVGVVVGRWCQTNANQSLFLKSSDLLCRTQLTPLGQSGGTVQLEIVA